MPVLPLIDLMLLSGWTSLFVGFVLKAIHLTTSYRPTLLGLTPLDFLLIAVAAFLFAIALAARTWVKTQEPAAVAARRREETLDAWNALPRTPSGDGASPTTVAPDTEAMIPAGAPRASSSASGSAS
ncbi:MAG TPA: hypothetical protein VKA74_02550 [Myxococcota bacterium]|nr:hypothetical protein [Myxococcota bacterium]